MARGYKLNALGLKKLAAPGRYGDGAGLWLQVRSPVNRSWVFRYMQDGKARWMGLGDAGTVSLAQARQLAAEARKQLVAGIDPIEHRRAVVAERKRARAVPTFAEAAAAYIKANEAGWRNAKHGAQWTATLAAHVYPEFGTKRISLIETGDVLAALQPVWAEIPETASRVRGRIEAIIDFAKARGWFAGENPARWKGHLANALPKKTKVARVVHHAALPWVDVPAFMSALAEQDGISAKAFRFLILTAGRTGEVVGARWSEINLAESVWTIPAERMKAEREHRIPMSQAALDILTEMKPLARADGYVFPGGRKTGHLSNMSFLMLLRRMKRTDLTGHGFRSTFRDWAGDSAKARREVAEAALAHVIGNATEVAYARTDHLEARRELMDAWGAFCTGTPPAAAT